jgi:conjugal transfer pilus assembly protein TraE
MDIRVKATSIASLQTQRNGLAGLSLTLLVVVVMQSFLLFFKSTQTIILPPETKQSFWVEGNRFSPVYLEEQGMYFAHLLLDVSASNILAQGEILLRYVDSSYHGEFKTRLFKEERRLKRDNLSLNFVVCDCEVFPSEMALEITGDLNGYVAGKKISSHRESYRLDFLSVKGRLFLKSFKVLKSDQEIYSDPQSEADSNTNANANSTQEGK